MFSGLNVNAGQRIGEAQDIEISREVQHVVVHSTRELVMHAVAVTIALVVKNVIRALVEATGARSLTSMLPSR